MVNNDEVLDVFSLTADQKVALLGCLISRMKDNKEFEKVLIEETKNVSTLDFSFLD